MVFLENSQAMNSLSLDQISSPRISFSADFLDEENYISISPNSPLPKKLDLDTDKTRNPDFEFLTGKPNIHSKKMSSAEELIFEGKLLPFWETRHSNTLSSINIQHGITEHEPESNKEEPSISICNNSNGNGNHISASNTNKINWFIDEDPSPRPPTCTVLWKELLRLKKQRNSTLSPSSSSSSSSSSNSTRAMAEAAKMEEGKKEKNEKKKKVLERSRSSSIRIRPVVNLPICTQGKSTGLPPLFFLKKGKVER